MSADLDMGRVQEVLAQLPEALRPLSSGLDHIGVAVESIEDSLALYHELLGLKLLFTEEVESDGVRVAVLELGGGHLELLEPTGPESPIAKFMSKRGPGIHHVALRVKDCASSLQALADSGVRLIDEKPRPGAGGKQIGFVHPKATGGVLLELCAHA